MIDPAVPPITVTEHDLLKVKVVEHLTAAIGIGLALAAVHQEARYRKSLLDTARTLAELIDGQQWESAELRDWWKHEHQTPWVERMARKINANDIEGVQRLAQQMQFQHPLPRMVVGPAA